MTHEMYLEVKANPDKYLGRQVEYKTFGKGVLRGVITRNGIESLIVYDYEAGTIYVSYDCAEFSKVKFEQKLSRWTTDDDIKLESINTIFDACAKANIASEDKTLSQLRDWLNSFKSRV